MTSKQFKKQRDFSDSDSFDDKPNYRKKMSERAKFKNKQNSIKEEFGKYVIDDRNSDHLFLSRNIST